MLSLKHSFSNDDVLKSHCFLSTSLKNGGFGAHDYHDKPVVIYLVLCFGPMITIFIVYNMISCAIYPSLLSLPFPSQIRCMIETFAP